MNHRRSLSKQMVQTGINRVGHLPLENIVWECGIKSWMLLLFFYLFTAAANGQAQPKKPNIILILADDLGWADLSCYGSSFYETPHLDALAKKGIKFTQAYASSPVCSPTRASVMTGKYPVKTGVTDWIPGRQENGKALPFEKMLGSATAYQLSLSENTLAEQLKNSGYQTFFAGKWHLGEAEKYWPEYQGFDSNKGGWSKGGPTGKKNDSTGGYFTPYQNPRLPDGPPGEYLTDRLTDECLRFLEANHEAPFLLMYAMYAVHNPLQAPATLVKKYEQKRKGIVPAGQSAFVKDEQWMQNEKGWQRRVVQDNPVYAAMIENMDSNIGRILNKLDALKIADNTIVIFTSDNGGLSTAEGSPTTNGPLRAGKGWLYEGGIRVPFIMYGKGITPAALITDVPVCAADIFPTLAAMGNNKYRKDKAVDGQDLLQLLKDSVDAARRPLYWHYPHYSNQGGRPGAAIREGQWKLIYHYEDESVELYDLVNDIGEKTDLAALQTEKAAALKKKLMQWLQENNASSPTPNKNYQGQTK